MTRQPTSPPGAPPRESGDDLSRIHGIGPVIQSHMQRAGISTFASLAALSAEAIAALVPNVSAAQITRQGWIQQARRLIPVKAKARTHRKGRGITTSRQHYDNFTVEFLLDEKNKPRRIRMVHVQSGDVDTWAKWDADRMYDFLARHTGARLSYAKRAILPTSNLIPKPSISEEGSSDPRTATTSEPPIDKARESIDAKPIFKIPESHSQPLKSSDQLRPNMVSNSLTPAGTPIDPNSKIRLLTWKNLIAAMNQPLHNAAPHGQSFDVNLTLDLPNAALPNISQLDFTALLYAKKLGNRQAQMVGEAQRTLPYANIVDLTIGHFTLPQGLYRLEVLLTLIPIDSCSVPGSAISTSFEGGLFQVY